MSDQVGRVARGAPRGARAAGACLAAVLAAAASAGELEKVRDIADNSFLVEEAFNQEDGVVHQMALFTRDARTGDWVGTLTQEWPVGGEKHQVSYTAAVAHATARSAATGPGDVYLHYRYQLLGDDDAVAFAPRASALLPGGDAARGLGLGGYGVQVNLPVSADLGRWVASHTNAGATWVPDGRVLGRAASVVGYAVGEGVVLRVHRRFNLLVETLWTRTELTSGGRTARTDTLVVSPGFRAGFDFRSGLQIVTGLGVPLGVGPSAGDVAVLGYLSFELPFNEVGMRNAPGGPVRPPSPARAEAAPREEPGADAASAAR